MRLGHDFVLLNLPVEVDVEIVPVVEWLVSLPGVRTLYSCQGEEYDYCEAWCQCKASRPMVMFVCDDEQSLTTVFEAIEGFCGTGEKRIEVGMDFFQKVEFRYTLYWRETHHLRDFTQWLIEQGSIPSHFH